MVNINLIINKISLAKKYLALVKKLRKFSFKEVKSDPFISGNVERYLYLLCQSIIDLAETTIASCNFRQPTKAKEAFEILVEEDVIKNDLSNSMQSLVGFRNLLSHEYFALDYKKVYYVLQEQSEETLKFIKAIEKKFNI